MPKLVLERPDAVRVSDVPGLTFDAERVEPVVGDAKTSSPDKEDDDDDVFYLIIHGLNSHKANPNVRALSVGLATRGKRCVAFDLPGHGACDKEKGDVRGIFKGKEAALERARRTLRSVGAKKVVVCGSSMGGALAVYCANELRSEQEFEIVRVVLINPLVKMKKAFPQAVLGALWALSRVTPWLEVSPRPTDKIDAVDENDRPDFDDEAQEQCDADELTWKKGVSLRTAVELYDLTRHNAGEKEVECGLVKLSFHVPILLVTGGRDDVVPPGEAIDRARLAVSAGGKAEHIKFERAGHSLTLQSRREEFFDLVANWRWA